MVNLPVSGGVTSSIIGPEVNPMAILDWFGVWRGRSVGVSFVVSGVSLGPLVVRDQGPMGWPGATGLPGSGSDSWEYSNT